MSGLCTGLAGLEIESPQCSPLQVKKAVSLLAAGQGNAALFREIKGNMKSVLSMLEATRTLWEVNTDKAGTKHHPYDVLLPHLLAITASDCGEETLPELLSKACQRVLFKVRGSARVRVRVRVRLVIRVELFLIRYL
jgi:hypothetical protein